MCGRRSSLFWDTITFFSLKMFYFSLHGRGLALGEEVEASWALFQEKKKANDDNLCVFLDCCGKREADSGAKAFDLLVWAATKVLK